MTTTAPLLVLIRAYQRWISPAMSPHCRFAPSCSAYAVAALTDYGLGRGGWLAVRRLARCHPFSAGGHDPVPTRQRRAVPPAHVTPTGAPRC